MRLAVGLDVGTTTIRCVIGHLDGSNPSATVIGVGTAPNNGMRKGAVVNIVNTAHAIDRALDEAERMSGHRVRGVSVSVNGAHITAMTSKGVIAVTSPNNEISDDDLARAQEAATVVQLPANREILQVTPRSYQLDGQDNIKDPLGMSGVRLEVDAHVITALSPNVKNLLKSIEMTQTEVHNVVTAGLAAAKAVLSPQQMENGVAVIDIGGTTTNLAVFEEGDLQHVAVIPMGSVHITNDLAIGLRTDLDVAEAIKLQYASAMPTSDKNASKTVEYKYGNEKLQFDASDIEMIIGARLDEIFELIDKELHSVDRSGKLPGGVVLTGGGASMRHIAEYAKNKLRLAARVGAFGGFTGMTDKIAKPEFATALGLMMTDLEVGAAPAENTRKKNDGDGQSIGKLFKHASGLLKKFKP